MTSELRLRIFYCNKLDVIREVSEVAYNHAKSFVLSKVEDGSYTLDKGVIANVMTYNTKPIEFTKYQNHRKYIDVQLILYGQELMAVDNIKTMMDRIIVEYDEKRTLLYTTTMMVLFTY